MKEVNLLYYVNFGKGDSSDWISYSIKLTNEEFAIYDDAIKNKLKLNAIPELTHILNRAYAEIEEMEIQNGIDNEDEFVLECQGLLDDEEDDEDFEPCSPFDCGWTLTVKFDDPNFNVYED
jgi:hypothetical protein